MTFAISWEPSESNAGGFLLFDAVTSWNRSFTGAVTKHPIDGGSNISDHYINNNPVFTMSAVISEVDIARISGILQNELGESPSNARHRPTAVQVTSTDASSLMKYLPNVIGQFLSDSTPEILMDGVPGSEGDGVLDESRFRGSSYIEGIQDLLVSLQSGEGINLVTGQLETTIRPVTLYETNDNDISLVKKLPADDTKALIITGLNFREDTESGYALYADITFELIRFANLKKVALPPDLVQAPVKKKVATKKSLGKCDSTTKDTATSGDASKSGAVDNAQNDVDPERNVAGEI